MHFNRISSFIFAVLTAALVFSPRESHAEEKQELWTDNNGHSWQVYFQDCRETGCGDKAECVPFEKIDCSTRPECGMAGQCTAFQSHGTARYGDYVCTNWSVCGAASNAQCLGSQGCVASGRCDHKKETYFYANKCGSEEYACYDVATHQCDVSPEGCEASTQCRTLGRCGIYHTPGYPRCEPTKNEHCEQSAVCRETGACGVINISPTVCAPLTTEHCAQSADCRRFGRCALKEADRWTQPICVAETEEHCRESLICKAEGKCSVEEGRCMTL